MGVRMCWRAAGVSRAFDFCKAHPHAKVLVVCVELCSLTFQPNDFSKSNLIGASLFADGAACILVCGDDLTIDTKKQHLLFWQQALNGCQIQKM